MNKTIKWSAFGVVFALIAIALYTLIDSNWAQENNASILVTVGFFLMATAAIVCGFNAVDGNNSISQEH